MWSSYAKLTKQNTAFDLVDLHPPPSHQKCFTEAPPIRATSFPTSRLSEIVSLNQFPRDFSKRPRSNTIHTPTPTPTPVFSRPQQSHHVTAIRQGLTANIHRMALTQPSTTATPTTASAESQPPKLHLPSPQIFDILPALHEILSRIDHVPLSNDPLDPSLIADAEAADVGALYSDVPPLEPKDLPAEVLQVKTRIRRAVRELEKLPDMHRSVAEQEEEIAELEERIGKQRAMLKRLAVLAAEMEGKGG